MNKIKAILSLCFCFTMVFAFTSCDNNPYKDVDFDKYIEVAQYKGIEVDPISVEVTDEDVTAEIQTRLEAEKTTKEVKEGVVANGDTINIDYVGSIDGAKFDGGSAKDQMLTIGSGTMIPGFESSLVGAKVGATTNIKVTFPEDYSAEKLAGKNAVFAVTVNYVEKESIPAFDDKFVKEHSDVNTVAEYTEMVRKELTESKKKEAEDNQKATVWSNLISNSKMKTDKDGNEIYPQEQLDRVVEETRGTYEELAKQSSMSLADFVQQNFGMDEATFNTQLDALAKIMVKEELVVYYIAEKEGIEISRADYKKYVQDTLAQYGYTEDSYKEANNGKSYEKVVGKEQIEAETLKVKVQNFVYENVKVKEAAPPAEETTTEEE